METLSVGLIDLNTPVGGAHFALANLARALSEKGHEIHVVWGLRHESKRLRSLCEPECHVHRIDGYRNIFNALSSMGRIREDIEDLCGTFGFDVLHVQGLNGLFVPSSLLDRLIVTLHGNNLYRGLTLVRFSLAHIYNPYFAECIRAIVDDGLGALTYWALEKKACRRARRVIVLSDFEADMAEKYYGLSRAKMCTVPSPVVLPEGKDHDPRSENMERMLLTVGSLSLIKGTPLLARASENILSRRRDVGHVFVGTGPLCGIIRNLEAKFPDRIQVIPSASDEMTSIYNNSALLIHGSLYESQGLVLGEAMLAEKPVVAFNVASIPECVVDGVTGYLADPFSSDALAEKALCILDDDEKAKEMGRMGRRRAMDLYSSEGVAERVEEVYREALMDAES